MIIFCRIVSFHLVLFNVRSPRPSKVQKSSLNLISNAKKIRTVFLFHGVHCSNMLLIGLFIRYLIHRIGILIYLGISELHIKLKHSIFFEISHKQEMKSMKQSEKYC